MWQETPAFEELKHSFRTAFPSRSLGTREKEELISKLAELGLSKDEINKLVETFIYAMGLIKNEKPIRLDNSSQNDQIEECRSSDGLFNASC